MLFSLIICLSPELHNHSVEIAFMSCVSMAWGLGRNIHYFSDMGLYKLLYLITDKELLDDMSVKLLHPPLEHDRKHNAEYIRALEYYLLSISGLFWDFFANETSVHFPGLLRFLNNRNTPVPPV